MSWRARPRSAGAGSPSWERPAVLRPGQAGQTPCPLLSAGRSLRMPRGYSVARWLPFHLPMRSGDASLGGRMCTGYFRNSRHGKLRRQHQCWGRTVQRHRSRTRFVPSACSPGPAISAASAALARRVKPIQRSRRSLGPDERPKARGRQDGRPACGGGPNAAGDARHLHGPVQIRRLCAGAATLVQTVDAKSLLRCLPSPGPRELLQLGL